MMRHTQRTTFTTFSILTLFFFNDAHAEDWASRTFEIVKDGAFTMEYPLSWGKKPAYRQFNEVSDIRFGPYGPKSKPIFLVNLQAILAADVQTDADLMEVAKIDLETLKQTAFETDIPLNPISGPSASGYYFTVTDKESKYGEFDYLTMAVMGSDKLLIKVYFFSSDGAPDFGADALRMMENLKYTPPPPPEEKE